jgi:hypothetical protein
MTNAERLIERLDREITRKYGRITSQSEDRLVTRIEFDVYTQLAAVFDSMFDGDDHVVMDHLGGLNGLTLVVSIRP